MCLEVCLYLSDGDGAGQDADNGTEEKEGAAHSRSVTWALWNGGMGKTRREGEQEGISNLTMCDAYVTRFAHASC